MHAAADCPYDAPPAGVPPPRPSWRAVAAGPAAKGPAMSVLRYVCLSDLHLGADYSLLTGRHGGHADPGKPGKCLLALGAAVRPLLRQLPVDTPPTLVLLGDVLDLGLSPMGDVAQAFQHFAEQAMLDEAGRPLFAPRVLVVPGNHDHHLWRQAQDHGYLQALRGGRIERDLADLTPPFADGAGAPVACPLLDALLAQVPALQGSHAQIVYPNLALVDDRRQRCVVLHHGHFVDAVYRLMSTINALMDSDAPPPTVAQLEQQNGPWIDFLWSDLGSAGATGRTATTLYEVMRDGGASQQYLEGLSDLVLDKLSSGLGLSGRMTVTQGVALAPLVRAAIDATVGRGAQSQRDSYLDLITLADVADLRWYLDGPLRQQLEGHGLDPSALDMAFVYGHTHKPLQDELPLPGGGRPVAVFNTGGWVMDQPTMTRTQGAAAVFIDDALNLASLRLFTDPVDGVMDPVQAAGTGGVRDRANPMLAALHQAVQATQAAWVPFSQAVQRSTEHRAQVLLERYFDTDPAGTDTVTTPGTP